MKYATKDIAKLFPDLMQISDSSLRDKVAAGWNESITTGCGGKGWTFDELRTVKFTLLAGDIEMTFIDHLNSCCRQCIAIAKVLHRSFKAGGRELVPIGHRLSHRRFSAGRLRQAAGYRQGRIGQGGSRATSARLVRHPFSGVAMCYKHGIPGRGHAHRRHAFA